jgi:hypothetical protein
MNLLRNVLGLIFFIGIILPFVGYYPITTLIAWRQAENAESWETTRCIVRCGRDKRRSNLRLGYTTHYWINYGFKSRLERPKMPLGGDFPPVERLNLEPNLSKAERSRKIKEHFEKRRRQSIEASEKSREKWDKHDREMQIFNKEQLKYMQDGTEYFSVFHLDGWRYWGNYGWSRVCYDELNNRRKDGFEADCYIDPNNPEKVVFYRELGLSWGWIIILVLNTALMFGFLYLAFYLFFHELKKQRKTSPSIIAN